MGNESVGFKFMQSSPEEEGISSGAILAFLEEADASQIELHSFYFARHGKVIAEGWWQPYSAQRPHTLYSLSKSFTSTATGFALGEKLISLDDAVISFFPEDLPADVSENLAEMKIRHLLSMSTGHAEDTTGYLHSNGTGNWAAAFLARPVDFPPGTHFVYNSGATYMVSAILQKVTGSPVLEYLTPRLFDPLGIRNATWESCPRGINTGGWGLSVKTEDIARFGQLYLNNGILDGVRVLPEGWVEEASKSHISNGKDPDSDWSQGYGFQFWRSRYNTYRGDGAFGQFCIIMPEQESVLAITAGHGNMQEELNLVWKHLLPAMKSEKLSKSNSEYQELQRTLSSLKRKTPEGSSSSTLEPGLSGKVYKFAENDLNIDTVRFQFREEEGSIQIRNEGGLQEIPFSKIGDWIEGAAALGDFKLQAIASSGTWTAQDAFVLDICYTVTPYRTTLTFQFEDGKLQLDWTINVSFGPTEKKRIAGYLQ